MMLAQPRVSLGEAQHRGQAFWHRSRQLSCLTPRVPLTSCFSRLQFFFYSRVVLLQKRGTSRGLKVGGLVLR